MWGSRDRPTTSPALAGRLQSRFSKMQHSNSAGCELPICTGCSCRNSLSTSLRAIPSFPRNRALGVWTSPLCTPNRLVKRTPAGSLLLSPVSTGLSIKADKFAVRVHPHMALPWQAGLRHRCKGNSAAWARAALLPWALCEPQLVCPVTIKHSRKDELHSQLFNLTVTNAKVNVNQERASLCYHATKKPQGGTLGVFSWLFVVIILVRQCQASSQTDVRE